MLTIFSILLSFPIYLQLNFSVLLSDFIISYSYWFILLAIAVGLIYSGLLYFRNKSNKLNLFWTITLFVVRFVSVFLLVLLLLSPYFKTKNKYIEKPIVVMGLDNSASIILGKDSSFYKTTFPEQWINLTQQIGDDYKTESYLFGAEVRKSTIPDFSDELSDYSKFIEHISNEYSGMNIGAVIMAGDGIYNLGVEPVFAASGLSIPFYTIALGDTNSVTDLKIADVRFNSLVYKDDIFPIEVSVSAEMLNNKDAELVLSAFGKQQEKKRIKITGDNFSASYTFKLRATETGKHRIKIELITKETELNKSNNRYNIFIDVINNTQKILLLAYSPHPDITAINQSLRSVKQYETEVVYIKDVNKVNVADYDLIILHQIPSAFQRSDKLLNDLMNKEIPVLYILGKQSSLPAFNQVFKGMNILTSIGKFEEARADLNSLFTLFSFDMDYASQIEKLPPLIVPLGNYVVSQTAEVYAYQRINNITTDFPLIVFNNESGTKSGAVIGEGLWMWRMHNYLNDGNFEAFDSFLNKSIQYLVAKKDKRFFRIITKNEYSSSENVLLKAELYNASYESVNEADVSLRLINEDKQQFNYLFSPDATNYSLDLKHLDIGVYRYIAQTQLGNEKYEARGEFIVSGQSFESRRLKADHNMLFRLARAGNGKMLYPDELSELPKILADNDRLKKRIYFEEKLSGLNTMPIILAIILFLLSLEWFLRKYFGSY